MTRNLSVTSIIVAAGIAAATLLVFVFGIGSAFAAGPWYVTTTGNDANDCLSVPTACLTINAAITKASPGDTINVAAGTYNEQVQITKQLTLNGAKAGVDARTRSTVGESIIDNSCGPVQIMADNVVLDGFTIQGATDSTSSCFFAGIWDNPGYSGTNGGFRILNNIIQNNISGIGASNNGTIQALIQFNLIKNNNNAGPGSGSGFRTDFGLKNIVIDSNTFENNQVNLNNFGTGVTAPHAVTVSNNEIASTTSSGIVLFGMGGVAITDNNIHNDTNGVSVAGANDAITVSGNTFKNNSGDGIKVSDDYAVGANTNVTANRNGIEGNAITGVNVNSGTHTGDMDATCNWWGAADGPGPVGPGSGDGVSAGVTFQPWLTTSDLANGPCNGPAPVTVTIAKYVDGQHADATNAEGLSFPMTSCWSATNIGTGCGSFSLGPVGFNNPNPYEATTASMTSGASYSTNEDTTGNNVGADCAAGKPFALLGYSTGDSWGAATSSTVSTTSPAFTNITTNKFVVVWNKDCTPKLTVTKIVVNDNGGTATTSDFTLFIDNATTTSGVATTTASGAHVVSETNNPNYTATIGGDCDANGNVTLAAGESKTCTITNDDNPSFLKVHILKYLDGQKAVASTTSGYLFPMESTWKTTNLNGGATTTGNYVLGNFHGGAADQYGADTASMQAPANYSTHELTGGANQPLPPGAACQSGQYRLVGYSTSATSFAQAASSTVSTTTPSFFGLTADQYVIVWNEKCPTPPPACNAPVTQIIVSDTSNKIGGANAIAVAPHPAWTATIASSTTWIWQASSTPPNATVGFEKVFTATGTVLSVQLDIASDNSYKVFIDGVQVAADANVNNFQTATQDTYNLTANVTPGTHTLRIEVTNVGTYDLSGNPAGLLYKLTIVTCPPPAPAVTPATACAMDQAPAGYTRVDGSLGNDNVTIAPNTMFVGHGGNDKVNGGNGNFIVCTGTGNDTITLGSGDIHISANTGNNKITIGGGTGTITTGGANDTITTGTGPRTIDAGGGNNVIVTGDGDQMITTGNANDTITTGGGNDTIVAGGGKNVIKSNAGNDTITAGNANDNIDGGPGVDSCNADGGTNIVVNCSP